MDKYYIEAPAYANNAMEDSYPWSVKITKEQAMLFMNNYQLASAYYQKVRYNKYKISCPSQSKCFILLL